MNVALDHRLCVAPMMDCTDRHDRFFLRQITRRAVLYTEMITEAALLHGDTDRLLGFDAGEHPVAVQLGGSTPRSLARCAELAQSRGFDEVNLNVGCPSDRVQRGRFGACLMAEPSLVGECVAAMRERVSVPVTVKTRIGIDDRDSYEALHEFVATVTQAGCATLIVHARKAWLKGLSPKQNRTLPPLRHDVVRRLKTDFPTVEIVLNGGVTDIDQVRAHLGHLDGVMIGREAYRNPYMLSTADRVVFSDARPAPSRHEIVRAMYPYIEAELAAGAPLTRITRHMLGLFQGVAGAKRWRRSLSEHAHRPGAGLEVLEGALAQVPAREALPAA